MGWDWSKVAEHWWPILYQLLITGVALVCCWQHSPDRGDKWAVRAFRFNMPMQCMVGIMGFDGWALAVVLPRLSSEGADRMPTGVSLIVVFFLVAHLLTFWALGSRVALYSKASSLPAGSDEAMLPGTRQIRIEGSLCAVVIPAFVLTTIWLRLIIGGSGL